MVSDAFADLAVLTDEEKKVAEEKANKAAAADPSSRKKESVLVGKLGALAMKIGIYGTIIASIVVLVLIIRFCVEVNNIIFIYFSCLKLF